MTDLGFVVESVTTALTGLLVTDGYTAVRPRLKTILRRSQQEELQIEELDRLRDADPKTLRGAVHAHVQRLAAQDGDLLRQLRDALGAPEPRIKQDIHHNKISGPTQMGGVQVVNMYGANHEPEL